MALGDPYATATDLKNRLGLTTTTAAEDARLAGAVATASQEVELFCNRQFNSSGTESARSFTTNSGWSVLTDDFHTTPSEVTTTEVQGGGITIVTTLVDTDYSLRPLQTVRAGFSVAAPQWQLVNISNLRWPTACRGGLVTVTAKWGWAAVPTAVKEATLLLAEEYWKLKEAPFGVQNWGEFGPVRVNINRRAVGLLKQYARGKMKVA